MRSTPIVLLGVVVGLFLQACSSVQAVATHDARKQSPAKRSVIIEPEDLAGSLASGARPVLLDARTIEDFEPAHAVGATRIDTREWSTASRTGQGLNDSAAWSARISALGIDEKSRVIIYDDGGMTSAARAWFILRSCGVADVQVVNGGWSNLCPVLEPSLVQAGNAAEIVPTRFAATSPKQVTTQEELKQIVSRRSQLVIDLRTPEEYAAKPGEPKRTGHVPGATNLPHKQLLAGKGRLKSPEELREIFVAGGMSEEKPAVFYCQSGGRAAFGMLAAEYAGYDNVSNYYMSMGEWLADESCPVE